MAGSVLIIGGGIAGISSAIELARQGIKVRLVEEKSTLGGHAASYCCKATDKCHKCYACLVADRVNEVRNCPDVEIYTDSELFEISSAIGGFRAAIKRRPQYLSAEKCISCGLCAEVCPQKCIILPNPQVFPQQYVIDSPRCLNFLGQKCDICVKKCPVEAIGFDAEPEVRKFDVDAVVLATGFVPYDPLQKGTFGYGRFPNVISAIDLERMLQEDGMAGLKLPSTGEIAREVAFIQCVGSRYDQVEDDSHTNIYCSRVCCGYALRMANLILDRAPETQITVFFMDLQHFGKNFDEFVDNCSSQPNFSFIRGIPSKITRRNGKLELQYEDMIEGGVRQKPYDAVVLSVGMRPPSNGANRRLAEMLDIELDRFGFLRNSGIERPVATASERVYLVGGCRGPKDIGECINEAATVSAEIAALVAIGNLLVVEPQQVQQRGVEIVHMHRVLDDMKTEVVGLAVDETPLHPTAG